MKKAMLFLTMFGCACFAWAVHPFAGTWKLNVAKSKPAAGQTIPVKEMTVICKEVGTDLETVFTGTGPDGKPFEYKFTNPQLGGVLGAGPAAQSPAEASFIVITVMNPSDIYGTSIEKGKQVEVSHTVVSRDGKTMTRTVKGMNAQGKTTESLQVFEKQ